MARGRCPLACALLALVACVAPSNAQTKEPDMHALPPEFQTARPIRARRAPVVTVGQDRGDLRGADDKVIQAAMDYVHRLGGGEVRVLPGEYVLRNAIFPRPGVTLRGSGEGTVLRKAASARTRIVREADWFEYALRVENPAGFSPCTFVTV